MPRSATLQRSEPTSEGPCGATPLSCETDANHVAANNKPHRMDRPPMTETSSLRSPRTTKSRGIQSETGDQCPPVSGTKRTGRICRTLTSPFSRLRTSSSICTENCSPTGMTSTPPGASCSIRGGRRGHDDRVERRGLGPAVVTVAEARLHAVVAEPREPPAGLPGQRLHDLDGVDLCGQLREHRRLISRAGADLEGAPAWLDLEQVGHERNDVGLRDGLAVTDGQGAVRVGGGARLLGNELVPRHPFDRSHHRGVDCLHPGAFSRR